MFYKVYKPASLLLCIFITLASGAQFKINSGTHFINTGSVALDGHFINDGTFTSTNGANVVFIGQSNQMMQGSGNTQFYGLEIAKPSNNIWLQTNIKVGGPLKFTKGSLDLTYSSLQLIYPNGLLQNETEQNRIYSTGSGVVFIEQLLNAPNNMNPGNLGFSITSPNNLGSTVVYRGHDRQSKTNGDLSISRHYAVIPTTNNSIYVNYTVRYFDAELNAHPENAFTFHQKIGAAEWQKAAIDGTNTQGNLIDVIGTTSLHKYTLFPAAQAPLPLQLLAFNAHCKNNTALLQWITTNEVATKQFTVEKSDNAVAWFPVQTLSAQGNAVQHTYATTIASTGDAYYRLKMEDKDGKFTYSPVKKMSCKDENNIHVGPNPTTGPLNITFELTKKETGTIQVFDSKGSLLKSRSFIAAQGLHVERMDMAGYPAGKYVILISSGSGWKETRQIIKQ